MTTGTVVVEGERVVVVDAGQHESLVHTYPSGQVSEIQAEWQIDYNIAKNLDYLCYELILSF